MTAVKGNSGRAQSRRLTRKIGAIVGFFAAFLVLYEATSYLFGGRRRGGGGEGKYGRARARTRAGEKWERLRGSLGAGRGRSEAESLEAVLSASVHLVEVRPGANLERAGRFVEGAGRYSNVEGVFCRIAWDMHKADPSHHPMFRTLVEDSPGCQGPRIRLDLAAVAAAARERDGGTALRPYPSHPAQAQEEEEEDGDDGDDGGDGDDGMEGLRNPRALHPRGFVFHESRCGSTLIANALAAFDPEGTRVYSEAAPLASALRACDGGKCSQDTGAALVRDVVYLMGRTDHPTERNLFFKIQSVATRYIDVLTRAFPSTPYLFVYRDPVQVMMSHLGVGRMENANCVRPRKARDQYVLDLVSAAAPGRRVATLTHEEYCAAHLATICDAAVAGLRRTADAGTGRVVNYRDLPAALEFLVPDHFGADLGTDGWDRIVRISGQYSKGIGARAATWKGDDSEKKEQRASDAIRGASLLFLDSSYAALEDMNLGLLGLEGVLDDDDYDGRVEDVDY